MRAHASRLIVDGSPYVGRGVIVETLGRSGVRVSERCDLKLGDVRAQEGRFRITDSKTEAGVREVQMTRDLADRFARHVAQISAAGHPIGPADYAFPNVRGGRMTRQRVGQIVRDAAAAATTRMQANGLPPLPGVTPHTMRRTYISIALLANHFDVKWVMSQVGHANSKMTMDVYAQLEHRADRSHGTAFDELLRKAKRQPDGAEWDTFGARSPNEADSSA
jgi:integrase